ncbi:MAG: hypothetical protein NTW21_41215 [Verrucomicrobia bacterium]|nr:hypothetical protein [Verrucomicrobiota bacterium]
MSKIRTFVSPVQKELALERAAVAPMVAIDPFLLQHCEVVLYRPCSRNPLITQTLALLGQMEQRGTGFARMRDAMLNHGLDAQSFTEQDGYFIVTLPGPNGDYDRITVPQGTAGLITQAVEVRLNERQKKIMVEVQQNGSVTSGWRRKSLKVSYDTANRDLLELVEFKLLIRQGSGRASSFVIRHSP